MKFLGNILWLILGGIFIALIYYFVGLLMCISIQWFSGSTPLTARIHNEMANNISGMEPEKVNRMLDNILDKIFALQAEHPGVAIPLGQRTFPATYDYTTLKPHPDYLEAVRNSVEMLKEYGVPISDALVLD